MYKTCVRDRISYYSVPCTYVKDLCSVPSTYVKNVVDTCVEDICKYICRRHICVIESAPIASLVHMLKTYVASFSTYVKDVVDTYVEDIYAS